ncbi:MAG: hypothetical protein JWQ10_1866 [Herbaspirillum sp.]|nr:hypothetical protein [Herbaspirillum sp.]
MQNKAFTKMHSNSRPETSIALRYATIAGRADQWFFLRDATPSSSVSASRALRADSCLIEPECGDTVLVCVGNGLGTASYILALLTRADQHSAKLTLPGDVAINTAQGQLSLCADRIALAGGSSVSLAAPEMTVAALKGELKFAALNASAQQVDARFGSAVMLAQSMHASIGKLIQKAKNSFRWIENLDETRAARIRLQVEDRYSLKTKHASLIADGLVKIDGERIDLG